MKEAYRLLNQEEVKDLKLIITVFSDKTIAKEEIKKKCNRNMTMDHKNKERFLWFHTNPLIKPSTADML